MSVHQTESTENEPAATEVLALVREEWPDLDEEQLAKTDADPKKLVALIVEHTGQTRALTRRQVAELVALAGTSSPDRQRNGASRSRSNTHLDVQVDEIFAAIKRLESFASDEARKIMPAAEGRVRKNLWQSLLITLGFGLILGLWLNGGKRRN